ncbi:MAG: hypothetical protein KIT69_07010, partial [Propionibacteriaceae bacterium]|nr:hypothetical protein [Propionibacteriaceae bacterium]
RDIDNNDNKSITLYNIKNHLFNSYMNKNILEPKNAGFLTKDQIKTSKVIIETNIINDRIIYNIENCAELIAINAKNILVQALTKMVNLKLEDIGNYIAFWKGGIVCLFIHNFMNLSYENTLFCGESYFRNTQIDIPALTLTFNLDAIDKILNTNSYLNCILY